MADDTRLCERCGITFAVTRPTKRFCSERCRSYAEKSRRLARRRNEGRVPVSWSPYAPKPPIAAVCAECGESYMSDHALRKYCSPTCRGRVKERLKRERRKSAPCSVPGCDNSGVCSSQLCHMHYERRQKGLPMDAPKYDSLKGRRQSETCTVDGCGKPTYWLELCKRHYLGHHAQDGKAWAILEYESAGARKKTAHYGGKYGVVDRLAVFERDGWICQLCGDPVDPELRHPAVMSATIDHVVPLSWGGDHSMENCQLAHLSCNSSKQDLRIA